MARSLTIREQAGQVLTFGFEGTALGASTLEFIQSAQPGGVILFARNLKSARETHALLRECRRACRTPMFLCVDMEGGTVDRLQKLVAPAPAAAEVFHTGEKKLFWEHGELIGAECRMLGFNVDFAPVFDLALPPSETVLGNRAVSADANATIRYAQEFLRGLQSQKVLGCGKHFPGLGGANLDTHKQLPNIKASWRELWGNDLLPYRQLHRQCDFVMVAHAKYPAAVKDGLPASLSPYWMNTVLRKKVGFRGLIISDDLEMGGVLAAASVEDAAVQCIAAGADMFLVCHREELVRGAYENVVKRAEKDAKFRRQLARAAERVLAVKIKRRACLRFPPPPTQRNYLTMRRKMQAFAENIRRRGGD